MTGLAGRRTALKALMGAGAVAATGRVSASQEGRESRREVYVTERGVRADGATPVADALQGILYELAESGGGVAVFPVGRYLLEKTLLVPSGVHIVGHGAGTVLAGSRPAGEEGRALLANDGIATAGGYDGAHDFSVSHLALDTPMTNGIVLVHARNACFSHIYGVDAYHHHFDIAGSQNVITENLFLTGRSGTAPYQIDGTPYNNHIWDGRANVEPFHDDTPNDGIFLVNSVIRPTNRPNHGIHLHRQGGRNIFIDNVIVERVENGIYRDPGCGREDLFIRNVVVRDVSKRAVNFRATDSPDRRVTLDNLSVAGCEDPVAVEYRGCRDLTMRNVNVEARGDAGHITLADIETASLADIRVEGDGPGAGIALERCRHVFVSRLATRNTAGALRLESCTGVQYSGIMAVGPDGDPLDAQIVGTGCLTPWQAS